MHFSVFLVRMILIVGYCMLGFRWVDEKHKYYAMISFAMALLIGLNIVHMILAGKRISMDDLEEPKDQLTQNKWLRKAFAVLTCLVVLILWYFWNKYYDEGIAVAALFVLFLSPFDHLIWGPTTSYPFVNSNKHVLRGLTRLLRSIGLIIYFIGLYEYLLNIDNRKDAVVFMAVGFGMLFIRPVILLLSPRRTLQAITATPAPISIPALEPVQAVEPSPLSPVEPPPLSPQGAVAAGTAGLTSLKADFLALHQLAPHTRGYAFQRFLHQLFESHQIITRSAFRLTGEEIDGSFDLGAQTYLLEAKWHAKPTAQSDLLVFNGKVEGKSTWARGIFISYSGFTADGLTAFRHGKRTSIIGMDGNDLLLILDGRITLDNAIRRKAMKAVENNDFFIPLSQLI